MFGTALFCPEGASAEGLYDGRIIGVIGLNVLNGALVFPFLLIHSYRAETRTDMSLVFAMLILIALAVLWTNWVCPKILFRRLCPPTSHGQLTKRERREKRSLLQPDIALCRQIVLFSSLFCIVVTLPISVLLLFITLPGYLSDTLTYAVYPIISIAWMYKVICPKYYETRNTAIKKAVIYEVLCLVWMAVLIIAAFIAALVVVVILSFSGLLQF